MLPYSVGIDSDDIFYPSVTSHLGEWAIASHGRVLVHQGNWFSTCRKNKSAKALYTQPALLVLSQLQSTLFRKLT